jgi:hypothetical protein
VAISLRPREESTEFAIEWCLIPISSLRTLCVSAVNLSSKKLNAEITQR